MNARMMRKIVDAADRNDARAVRLLLLAGWPVNAPGNHGATALHFGAWHGNTDIVRDMLAHGSSTEIHDRDFNMTPLGWALHGSLHGSNRDRGNYGATVDALMKAGARAPAGGPDAVDASATARDALRRHQQQAGG